MEEAATLKTFKCKHCRRPLFDGQEFRLRLEGFEVEVVIKQAAFRCGCGAIREWREHGKRDKASGS